MNKIKYKGKFSAKKCSKSPSKMSFLATNVFSKSAKTELKFGTKLPKTDSLKSTQKNIQIPHCKYGDVSVVKASLNFTFLKVHLIQKTILSVLKGAIYPSKRGFIKQKSAFCCKMGRQVINQGALWNFLRSKILKFYKILLGVQI